MKLHLCAVPGCFRPVSEPGGYCEGHHVQAQAVARKKSLDTAARWERYHQTADFGRWYRSARWRRLRAAQLARAPFCPCGAHALTVDHIIPHMGREEFFFNEDNLQSLCWKCHARKSRADRDSANPYPPSKKERPQT